MRDNKAMCTQDPESPDLKQGDIFEFLHENRGDYRERYGVVITADCDIKKERAPFISYLPIYGMEEYAEHIWFPEICDDFVNQAKETMAERINRKRAKVSNSAKPMSSDAVAAWASRLGRDGVLNEIGVTDKGQRSDLGKHIDAYLRIVDACANGNLISKLSALCSYIIKEPMVLRSRFLI